MFAHLISFNIEIVDEMLGPGVVSCRKLSGESLSKAAEAKQIGFMQYAQKVGTETLKAARETAVAVKPGAGDPAPKPQTREEQDKARRATYERLNVLIAGIVSWTWPEVAPTPENIAGLDEADAELIFNKLLDRSLPPLPIEAEAVAAKG